ncbi:MAG TPA: CNNM domain-containing protein, partial [Anaeromyxobacteraceae bacterium]|nr:CNNM domain-containing protein [Anaeromyxobacteraceae bacterium]
MADGGDHPFTLAVLAAVLIVFRALISALEAALVAVGQPRAQALGAESGASARGRALLALASSREPTAALFRVVDTVAALLAGVLSAAVGLEIAPASPWLAAALALVVAAVVSLVLGAAARALGARHGEGMALALAVFARALAWLLAPVARAVAWMAQPLAGGPGLFALPPPPLEEMERALTEYARSAGTPSDQATSELIQAVFEFRDKVARDVMVPRTEVVAIEIETPVPEILRLLAE